MIELPRGLAREFRAVLRKCTLGRSREASPFVVCSAGAGGLTLTCESNGVILRHRTAGKFPEGVIAFTADLFDKLEALRVSLKLVQSAAMKGKALWQEGAEMREMDFEAPEVMEPELPDVRLHDPGGGFLAALTEAVKTTSKDSTRFALRCVMLRGAEGSVIASNGRQLLVQRGFAFPWKGDALVPALPVLASRELIQARLAMIGRSAGQVVLNCGPWSLVLKEEESRHYPDVGKVLAPGDEKVSVLRIDPADARQLTQSLPTLPGADEEYSPVTLELSGRPGVSAAEERIPLPGSRCQGPALSVRTDRRYLLRAICLGFRELSARANGPLVCRENARVYAWMPLDTSQPAKHQRRDEPLNARDGPTKNAPPVNPQAASAPQPMNGTPTTSAGELEEAEALRNQLQEALARTARLIAVLRRRKREDRAVRSAVESLRRLGP